MKALPACVAALLGLAAIGWAVLAPPISVQGSNGPSVYLPIVYTDPAGCQPTGQTYGSLPIVGSPLNMPAAQDPDINLDLRGWATAPGNPARALVTYTGGSGGPDPNAPQLAGLFNPAQLPAFSATYDVYNWNWATSSKGSLDDNPWPVTLLGLATQQGEAISVPSSGYSIGQGYEVLVLYATNDQITVTFTGNDSIVSGYALHVENVCVDPSLQTLYNQLNAAGRTTLPALRSGQTFGTAIGTEIQVAIRDTGTFMDPRSQTDWWKSYSAASFITAVRPRT